MISYELLSSDKHTAASSSKDKECPCDVIGIETIKKQNISIYSKENKKAELNHTESESSNGAENKKKKRPIDKEEKVKGKEYWKNYLSQEERDKLDKIEKEEKVKDKEYWKNYLTQEERATLDKIEEEEKVKTKEYWKNYLTQEEKDTLDKNKPLSGNEELRIHSDEHVKKFIEDAESAILNQVQESPNGNEESWTVTQDNWKKHKDKKIEGLSNSDENYTPLGGNETKKIERNGNHAEPEKLKVGDKQTRLSFNENLNKQISSEPMQGKEEHAKTVKLKVLTVPHKFIESSSKLSDKCDWRRPCGCLKTSEKLKELLKRFPSAPPPPPPSPTSNFDTTMCISAYCTDECGTTPKPCDAKDDMMMKDYESANKTLKQTVAKRLWGLSSEIVNLIQTSVTAMALAIYYIIYFYMQLVYYLLISAMFFHNADGAMKITIGVVTLTSLIVGFNLLVRMEKLVGLTVVANE